MDAPTFTVSKCLNVSVKTQKKERPYESISSLWFCRISVGKLAKVALFLFSQPTDKVILSVIKAP